MSEAIPSWARVGAKVVCIDASGLLNRVNAYGNEKVPEQGGIYTIREVVFPDGQTPCLLLREIHNEPQYYEFGVQEFVFRTYRFRPLVSQADDISTHFAQYIDTRAPELV